MSLKVPRAKWWTRFDILAAVTLRISFLGAWCSGWLRTAGNEWQTPGEIVRKCSLNYPRLLFRCRLHGLYCFSQCRQRPERVPDLYTEQKHYGFSLGACFRRTKDYSTHPGAILGVLVCVLRLIGKTIVSTFAEYVYAIQPSHNNTSASYNWSILLDRERISTAKVAFNVKYQVASPCWW